MIIYPKYPNDIYELEKIQNLLDKIPLYENKLQYLIHLIDQLVSKDKKTLDYLQVKL
jgi:hypothetical protein